MSNATKYLPEVERFLASDPIATVISGKDVLARSGKTFQSHDPGNGRLIANITAMDKVDVDAAVSAADSAFLLWSQLTQQQRADWINRLADEIERRIAIFAQIEAVDAGKLLFQAEGDMKNVVITLRYFASIARTANLKKALNVAGYDAYRVYKPWGACGFIIPWNFPMLLIAWGIAPALAAGNTVVIKPAENTSLSAIYLARVAREIGFPDGVINVVTGYGETAGAALSAYPGLKRMGFTGSPEVGKLVAEASARNLTPSKLELGGKGAAIILNDVDVNFVADRLAAAITFHCGQVCCDATRWLVQDRVYDDFVAAVSTRMKAVKVGHQFASGATMGPIVSKVQQSRVTRYIGLGKEQGAELLLGGNVADTADTAQGGFYVEPTLLAGPLNNVAAQEEIFGPVAYISRFSNDDDAVTMTNASQYGLANSVWSQDITRAQSVAEQLVAGNSWINVHNVFPMGVPYGGINLSGMGGGVNSEETFYDYLRGLSVVRPL